MSPRSLGFAHPAACRAVLAELDRDDADLNLDVLAQACARKARHPSADREESIGWAAAAIACYGKVAERRVKGFDRMGSETMLYGVMVATIMKWGPEPGHDVLDPAKVVSWIQEGVEASKNPDDTEAAYCLRERLEIGRSLLEAGLLPASLHAWVRQLETS